MLLHLLFCPEFSFAIFTCERHFWKFPRKKKNKWILLSAPMSASAHVVLGQFGLVLNAFCKFAVVYLIFANMITIHTGTRLYEHDCHWQLCSPRLMLWRVVTSTHIHMRFRICAFFYAQSTLTSVIVSSCSVMYHFRNWSFLVPRIRFPLCHIRMDFCEHNCHFTDVWRALAFLMNIIVFS